MISHKEMLIITKGHSGRLTAIHPPPQGRWFRSRWTWRRCRRWPQGPWEPALSASCDEPAGFHSHSSCWTGSLPHTGISRRLTTPLAENRKDRCRNPTSKFGGQTWWVSLLAEIPEGQRATSKRDNHCWLHQRRSISIVTFPWRDGVCKSLYPSPRPCKSTYFNPLQDWWSM